jgi:hypothetical protein
MKWQPNHARLSISIAAQDDKTGIWSLQRRRCQESSIDGQWNSASGQKAFARRHDRLISLRRRPHIRRFTAASAAGRRLLACVLRIVTDNLIDSDTLTPQGGYDQPEVSH